mmetsp:Transcript_11568/g.41277  ORF Transcript_11568/g.41277 Transcript_11568/m.41277 type:complete len:482 (+) Transcript_11568:309-1754(+)
MRAASSSPSRRCRCRRCCAAGAVSAVACTLEGSGSNDGGIGVGGGGAVASATDGGGLGRDGRGRVKTVRRLCQRCCRSRRRRSIEKHVGVVSDQLLPIAARCPYVGVVVQQPRVAPFTSRICHVVARPWRGSVVHDHGVEAESQRLLGDAELSQVQLHRERHRLVYLVELFFRSIPPESFQVQGQEPWSHNQGLLEVCRVSAANLTRSRDPLVGEISPEHNWQAAALAALKLQGEVPKALPHLMVLIATLACEMVVQLGREQPQGGLALVSVDAVAQLIVKAAHKRQEKLVGVLLAEAVVLRHRSTHRALQIPRTHSASRAVVRELSQDVPHAAPQIRSAIAAAGPRGAERRGQLGEGRQRLQDGIDVAHVPQVLQSAPQARTALRGADGGGGGPSGRGGRGFGRAHGRPSVHGAPSRRRGHLDSALGSNRQLAIRASLEHRAQALRAHACGRDAGGAPGDAAAAGATDAEALRGSSPRRR